MAPDTPVWPCQRRYPSHRRPETGELLGAGGVDHEALTEEIERPNEAQGVLAQPGRGPAED